MASKNYLPSKEGEIVPWIENFVQVANVNAAALGLATTDINALKTINTDLSLKINAAIAKQSESKAATESKNIQMDKALDNVRSLVRQVQAKPGVPDNLKIQLGITTSSPSPTTLTPVPPKDLSAELTPEGQCLLKWSRDTNPQGTIFIIETSDSTNEKWTMIGTITKTSYESKILLPLGKNCFRVIAQKGKILSQPSNVVLL